MSLRIVPAANHSTTFAAGANAPSAPGVHDTLRAGVGQTALDAKNNVPASAHPLEARLKNWEATQEGLRMETLRRTFGLAEPIRRQMELKVTRDGEWRPLALGGQQPSLHEEILRGKDASVTWEDVYTGDESVGIVGMHDEMERKLKI
ncbi:Proteasome maturation factor UMP1 [Colletotrichum musicola]|uniref:Proteasome maturation factor UMP1 n=3 Tax=Colletotrichum orchidearum species complex TaxID=2707337 RepID=A0A8H6NG79_9PEZI|nr:Proteasome maturation factor UMP1 [Colletotrichum sojae]KAF6819208.1 Proteasome maturation factor UMP1 [Colletotrichum plurivorum]KAF6832427.1 Proteasome maturation factor UMP1 [Colletotrichum musicola]